jgi:hypothetical protein
MERRDPIPLEIIFCNDFFDLRVSRFDIDFHFNSE